jgi:hypothetical protein
MYTYYYYYLYDSWFFVYISIIELLSGNRNLQNEMEWFIKKRGYVDDIIDELFVPQVSIS